MNYNYIIFKLKMFGLFSELHVITCGIKPELMKLANVRYWCLFTPEH